MNGEIIVALLGGGALVAVLELLLTAKGKKSLSATEAQRAKIDLGDTYIAKVLEMSERIEEHIDERNSEVLEELRTCNAHIQDVSARVSDIEKYLNGNFAKWKGEQHGTI